MIITNTEEKLSKIEVIQSVQNTPKIRPSESQQNQGVKSSDLDVQKGNVLWTTLSFYMRWGYKKTKPFHTSYMGFNNLDVISD